MASLAKVGRELPSLLPVGGALAGRAASELGGVSHRLRTARQEERRLTAGRRHLAELVGALGSLVAARALGRGQPPAFDTLVALASRALAPLESMSPTVGASILRPPNCFRGFDQRPLDCHRLAEKLASLWSDRDRPVVVVGLRTSGSYLAPLLASFLRLLGHRDVRWVSRRPGERRLAGEDEELSSLARHGGVAVLVDDPPNRGGALSRAAAELEALGFPREAVVLAVATLDDSGELPSRLAGRPAAVLPWKEWAVHEQLSPSSLRALLTGLLLGRPWPGEVGDDPVEAVGEIEVLEVTGPGRGHVAITVAVEGSTAGGPFARRLRVAGVGLGCLGSDAVAVADALGSLVPAVAGVVGGLMVRAWMPDESRVGVEDVDAALSEGMARYVRARSLALPLEADHSRELAGRGPVWELAAGLLGAPFGRVRPLVRPLARQAARRLLAVEQASAIDGVMSLANWFETPDGLRKVSFATLPSGSLDIYCFDPVFDLAGAAVAVQDATGRGGSVDTASFEEELRRCYRDGGGALGGDERWLLYLLVHMDLLRARALGRIGAHASPACIEEAAQRVVGLEVAMSAAVRRYLCGILAGPTSDRGSDPDRDPHQGDGRFAGVGGLCAVDIDGVLETRWSGFPSPSPSSVMALRALCRHGFRPVLATGRSLPEVVERCRSYGLAGGVAEYGGAVHDGRTGEVQSTLDDDERDALAYLRATLAHMPGVHLDPRHASSIRARSLTSQGLAGLERTVIEEALVESRTKARVAVHPTVTQTDFVPVGVDKGRGLRALAGKIGGAFGTETFVEMAIGDSEADVAMFGVSRMAFAPIDADAPARAHAEVLERPCQVALVEAAGRVLGHDAGTCERCRPPVPPGPDAALLLNFVDALGGRKREKVRQAARLAALLGAQTASSAARRPRSSNRRRSSATSSGQRRR